MCKNAAPCSADLKKYLRLGAFSGISILSSGMV